MWPLNWKNQLKCPIHQRTFFVLLTSVIINLGKSQSGGVILVCTDNYHAAGEGGGSLLFGKDTEMILENLCWVKDIPRFFVKNTRQDYFFVKLHSDLRILTQLQLLGVGVDFVFPLEEGRKEGRRRKKKKNNNPHLGSSRGCDSTCLKFLVGVWKVFANCLEVVWQVSKGV